MTTQQPVYYRDLLESILAEDEETLKLMRLKKLLRQLKSGSLAIPHWMRYMDEPDYYTSITNDPEDNEPGAEDRAFNIVLPINDAKNNIKDIVLSIRIDENNTDINADWFWVQFIREIEDSDEYDAFIESQEFSSALNQHLSRMLSANITDVGIAGGGGGFGNDNMEMESKSGQLSAAISRQLMPLHDLLIHGDDEVYQELKQKAA